VSRQGLAEKRKKKEEKKEDGHLASKPGAKFKKGGIWENENKGRTPPRTDGKGVRLV